MKRVLNERKFVKISKVHPKMVIKRVSEQIEYLKLILNADRVRRILFNIS